MSHRFYRHGGRRLVLFAVAAVILLGLASALDALADLGPGDGPDVAAGPLLSVSVERPASDWPAGGALAESDRERSALTLKSGPSAIPTPTYAAQVTELTNAERSKAGLPPLKSIDLLDGGALGHSTRMASADFFSHCDPDTHKRAWNRMIDAGYSYSSAGENIAAGYTTSETVIAAWMGSPSHRNNILSSDFREIGMGYYYQVADAATVRQDSNDDCTPDGFNQGPYYRYWTQDFGSRPNVWPLVIAGEAFEAPALNVSLFVYTPTLPSQMRLSNDGATWSVWQPFTTTVAWALNPGNGAKTVYGQVYNGATTYVVSDTIWLNAPPPVAPAVAISSAGGVTLTWQHQAVDLWYDVYRSNATPYFTPGGGEASLVGAHISTSGATVTFSDSTPDEIYFYLVQAVAGDGQTTTDSNRAGRFVFGLVAGD